MKLSDLEEMVHLMKKLAVEKGISDPRVTFYDNDRQDVIEAAKKLPFIDFDITGIIEDDGLENIDVLRQHMTISEYNNHNVGDFQIPLDVIKMTKELKFIDTLNEFAQIRRGESSGWKGDRILNSETYLKLIVASDEELAKDIAHNIGMNIEEYSDQTGLPERSLMQAMKYLTGEWK